MIDSQLFRQFARCMYYMYVPTYRAVGGMAAGADRAAPLFVAKAEGTCTVQHYYLPGKNILDLSHSNKLLNYQKAFTQSL